jgi:hypothetical protein
MIEGFDMLHSELLMRAAAWMQARGWKQKIAKRRGGVYPACPERSRREQSLFEHRLIELDVLLELLPILRSPRHYGLSEAEKAVLAVAVLAHDVGKETDAWRLNGLNDLRCLCRNYGGHGDGLGLNEKN